MKKLTADTPRLSDLPGNHSLLQCAKCGEPHQLTRWAEHDHQDKLECRVVVLCGVCSGKLIGPHPRLYKALTKTEFLPGSAGICAGCAWQKHLSCHCPLAKFNGGTGMAYTPQPSVAHLYGTGGCRMVALEFEPITRCTGKEFRA